nr:non-ribosomal peptide synthetase [Mycobacterium asiaticum]
MNSRLDAAGGGEVPIGPLGELDDGQSFWRVSTSPQRSTIDLEGFLPVVERIAGTDVGRAAALTVHHAAVQSVLLYGREALRQRYLDELLSGSTVGTLAITESDVSSSNPRLLASTATRDGDDWVIHAVKSCITGAEWAGLFVVLVPFSTDEGAALTTVVVPADSPGVRVLQREDTLGLQSVPVSAIRFDAVRVAPWQILGEIGDGLDVVGTGLRVGRICTGAISLGVMKRCMQIMYRFASRREVATGRLLADPEVVRRLSRITSEITAVDALLSDVAADPDAPQDISLALKVASSEFAFRAADDAVQMLGWRGYVEGNQVSSLMRDARFLRIGEGPSEALLTELGARLAARSDTVYTWIAERTPDEDLASRLRASAQELVQDNSVNAFYNLGWFCIWAIFEAAVGPGSAAMTFIESAWHSERVRAATSLRLEEGFDQVLPTYAETVGTLDEMLAERGTAPDAILRPRNRPNGPGLPIIGPERPGYRQTVHGLVFSQIERAPDAVALECEGPVRITYAELGNHADALAGRLAELGVLGGDVVGVFLSNTVHVAIASLAVQQAGAVLLILNPAHPLSRVTGMLADSGARCVIVDNDTRGILPPDAPELIQVDGIGEVALYSANTDPDAPSYLNFTSGSTGRPKGVLNSHCSFANELLWRRDEFGLGADDAILQSASPGFDIFMWEIFGPLVSGARLVFMSPAQREWNPLTIVEHVQQFGITVLQIVPSQLDVLLDEPGFNQCGSLRYVFCGGEPLSLALARRFAEVLPNTELVNLYGPTEAAIDALYWRVNLDDEASWAPIGRPIANARLYIVDAEGDLAVEGEPGELWIGGAGVALGYMGVPALTAQKFRRDVRTPGPGSRIYRTGDRVRQRPDGTVEFLGRMDRQLKVNGVRIEPGEIERVLCGHPGVQQAVVDVRDRAPGEKALVAYLVGGMDHETLDSASALEYARDKLPTSMVPAAIIVLDSLPRTPAGKVDLAALPNISFDDIGAGAGVLPPRLLVIAGIWEEILGIPITNPDADFFSIGGHSLAALRVIMRLRERTGVTLQMREFVEASTLNLVDALVEERRGQRSATDDVALAGPTPVDRSKPLPLSPVQANLWYLQQLVPTMAAYNIPEAVRIRGPVDIERLEAAFSEVVARHEALRTIFPSRQGEPVQSILPPRPIQVERADLGDTPPDRREAAALELLAKMSARPFDLFRELPIRVLRVSLAADDHYVAWCLHHIAADGWSAAGLLPVEVSNAYAALGAGESLPPLDVQPVDYVDWTVRLLDADRRAQLEDFWRDHLHDSPAEIELPRDLPRPVLGRFRGARVRISLSEADRQAIRTLARQQSATTYSVLVAAFMTWIAGYGRQRDMVVGGVTAGRSHPSVEGSIGNFANMVALRCRLGDDPAFADLVVRTRNEIREVVDHAALSFPEVVNVVRPERVGTRNPIFQAAVTLYDGDVIPLQIEESHVQPVTIDSGSAKFDLLASFVDDGASLSGFLEYDSDLFTARTAQRLGTEFTSAIRVLAQDPACTVEEYAERVRSAAARHAEPAPLTRAQRRIWLLDRMSGGGKELCSQRYFELRGNVDVNRLRAALDLLVQHHPGLATIFPEKERGVVQVVGRPTRVQMHDLRDRDGVIREELWRRVIDADAGQPINIAVDPPFRALIILVEDDRVILGMNYHHIVADFWSEATMFAELSALYADPRQPRRDSTKITMGELASAQVARASDPVAKASLDYWDQTFRGIPARLELPTDRPPLIRPSLQGARVTTRLADHVRAQLDDFATRTDIDRSTIILAMWQYLLRRYTNQETVVVGVPVPNRPTEMPVPPIGYFSDLVPIRADLASGLTLQAHATRTAERLSEAYTHTDMSFDDLVERFGSRMPKGAQLIEVSFVPEIPGAWGPNLNGLQVSPVPHDPGRALFKLGLSLESDTCDVGGELQLVFDFSTALWDAETIERMGAHLVTLLAAGLSEPDVPLERFAMLTDAEAAELRNVDARQAYPPEHPTLHRAFAAQLKMRPGAEAVKFAGPEPVSLTFAELDREATALAGLLMTKGVVRGDKVALLLERTERIPIAVLAILKTGSAYVPIDPSWPASRVQLVLDDCRPTVIVTESALRHVVAECEAPTIEIDVISAVNSALDPVPDLPDTDVDAEDTAYVIYTSGSTGRPKGVAVTHQNVMRLFTATDQLFEFTSDDRWTMFHSIAFDFSVWELWGALLHGGCVVVVPYLVSRNPAAFRELLSAERITVLNQTPSAFRLVRDADADDPSTLFLRYVIFGGEMLTFADLIPWIKAHGDSNPELINMYGITETTVHVTFRRLTRGDILGAHSSIIGRPIPDLECLLIDPEGNLVPYGVPGEICVGGPGLAKGYLGMPELTSQRFIAHPFRSGERLYRSGDSGRRLLDGEIEYLGRLDHQVQLRGFRIELGEVETAVLGLDDVMACYAMVRTEGGEPHLVVYVVTRGGEQLPLAETRRALAARIPDYMLPSGIVTLESLPLTVNGKINRAALPAYWTPPAPPEVAAAAPKDVGRDAPMRIDVNDTIRIDRNATIRLVRKSTADIGPVVDQICSVFADVLQLASVAAEDNFFDIGGDSMRAVQLSAKAKALGLQVSVQDLFRLQTPAELAAGLVPTETPRETLKVARATRQLLIPEGSEGAFPSDVKDAYPLSALQAGMLFHSRVDGPSVYHDVVNYLVQAPWDENAFRSALSDVTRRHQILCTTFDLSAYSVPLQLVHEPGSIPLKVIDVSDRPETEQDNALTEWMELEARRPIEWRTRTPLDVVIHLRGDDRFDLSLSFHHALLDGWSVMELQRDLLTTYDAFRSTGHPPAREPLQARFRDFIMLEQEAIGSPSRSFWQQQLNHVVPSLFPATPSGPRRLRVTFRQLQNSIEPRLRGLARRQRVSIKSTLLAAHIVVMGRLAASDDVVTGLVVNGRPETEDAASILGMFLNTVPLRVKLNAPNYRELVGAMFAAEHQGLPHRRVPLRTIQRDIGVGKLFETAFNYVELDAGGPDDPTLEKSSVLRRNIIEHTNLPLVTVFSREAGALGVGIEFDPRMISEEKVDLIVDAYEEAIGAIAEGGLAPLPDFAAETQLQCLYAARRAAPAKDGDALAAARAHLGRIWENVLGRPVGPNDSLLDSGGDSIQAMVVSERIAMAFGCHPPLEELLHGATVERLAYWLAAPQSVKAALRHEESTA